MQVADVKKNIETVQGSDVYPAAQQMLIHQGKVLKDATTLEENKVAENSFLVIMLSKVISNSLCLQAPKYYYFLVYFQLWIQSKTPTGQTSTAATAPKVLTYLF